jgi:hypothetical protein
MAAGAAMPGKSEIPFGAQFSPNQVDLPILLRIIKEKAGDREEITYAIRDKFFSDHASDQRWKLADNTVLSLRAYGLLDKDAALPTHLALDLLDVAGDPGQLYRRFARHILIDLRGHDFVETIVAMQAATESLTLVSLRDRLEHRGLHVPRGAVHLSSMRLWLAKAGVFDPSVKGGPRLYEVDKAVLQDITGIGLDAISKLAHLTFEQRCYLRALVRIPEDDPHMGNGIADLAAGLYCAQYNYKSLPKTVLLPLQNLGYITAKKSTAGRGAKPYLVFRTQKFRDEISEPILEVAAKKAQLVPRELFERPLASILADLESKDTFIKGQALELLAIYFARLLDLDFKGWRVRSSETGGLEVDVIVEGARLIFSRWQIQAKNTKTVRLDDVAREVGLSLTFIYSNVVMLMTTGEFTRDTYSYADHVMRTSNLNIILVNGPDLQKIADEPTKVIALLSSKAERAMQVKERTDYLRA